MPDLLEIVEKKAGSKVASFLATILGVFMLGFLIYILVTFWNDIDLFRGSGGNPQEGYMDDGY